MSSLEGLNDPKERELRVTMHIRKLDNLCVSETKKREATVEW